MGARTFLLLPPGTSRCAQRHGPLGQDGLRTGWLCWSGTLAISQKSIRWAGEWCPLLGSRGRGDDNQGLITAALPGPRSSSAFPRRCLPQRMLWKSGDRAWVREAPPFLSQGVRSGGQEINHCLWAPFPGSPPRPHSAALLLTSPSPCPRPRPLSCPWHKRWACSHIPLLPPTRFHLRSLLIYPHSAAPSAIPHPCHSVSSGSQAPVGP